MNAWTWFWWFERRLNKAKDSQRGDENEVLTECFRRFDEDIKVIRKVRRTDNEG